MSYEISKRIEIRERAGYYCQVCGMWFPPIMGKKTLLDAHSTTNDHKDGGITACSAQKSHNCHTKLHQAGRTSDGLEKVSRTAAQLNNLSVAVNMLDDGVPEKRIRRVLKRIGNF